LSTAPSPAARPSRSSPLAFHSIVSLAAVLLLAPLVALLVANLPIDMTLIVVSAVVLILIVLWSAEATFYVLIFSMLLSPEFIVGGVAEAASTTGSRGITLRFDDFVIAMIAIAWLVRLAVFKEAGVLRRTRMSAPILSYIGVCLLATGVGVLFGRVNALTGFLFVAKYFEYVVIYFLVVNYVHDRQQVKRLVAATLITAAIISVVVLAQIPGGERVTAPFEGDRGEPNTLGGYLVLMIALALAFLSEARDANSRLLWAGFAGMMTVPLVYTYSRTSWLGFVAMLMAVTLLCRTKTLFIVIVLAGLILLIVSPPEAILERTTYTITGRPAATGAITIGGITIEPSAAARLQSWSIAAQAVPQQPLLGWGVTGFSFIDSQYPRTLIESGLVGFAMLVWMLWSLFTMGRDLLRVSTRSFDTAVATGFLAALAGTIMHGIGANTFIIVRIMEPFWLLAGLTAVLLRLNRQEAATVAAAQLGEAPPAATRAAPPVPRQATRRLTGRRDLA